MRRAQTSSETLAQDMAGGLYLGVPSRRQQEILQRMADHRDDDEGELVYERGVAYLGDDRIAPRTVFALLRLCAISPDSTSAIGTGVERYRINETGRQLLSEGSGRR